MHPFLDSEGQPDPFEPENWAQNQVEPQKNGLDLAALGTVVDYDLEDRIVRINDMSLMNDPEDVLRYIHVPEGVNIFSLLNLDQPSNATNISNWKVGISTKHQYYPNITAVLDVSNGFYF